MEIPRERLQYMVGGLLYMPAFQKNIVEKLKLNSIECLTSIAFCLEDSIRDEALNEAEVTLKEIFRDLNVLSESNLKLPLIFIRVRSPEHLQSVYMKLFGFTDILTGYILPKFDLDNAEHYAAIIYDMNRNRRRPFYVMPILETEMIADITTRNESLIRIKRVLNVIEDYVLNIRVGVNDLSNIYGLRRDASHTIYDIGIIRDILINVLSVYAKDYVVAGAVYNHFGDNDIGFKRELISDRLNGFIGKTAIHPKQLPYIFDSLKVSRADYEDACQLLDWKSESHGVVKSVNGSRMNEVKCHVKWAERTKILSDIYGIHC